MIDAHVHFWDPARGDDILILRRVPSLSQRVTPSDLLPLMRAAGVTRAVAIQSAPDPSETSHLIATCKPIPEIAAVVGWVDLSAPDVAMNIKTLMRQPKIVGVRAMLNRIDRNDWLVSANVLAGLAALSDAGATLDLIARAEHIPAILSIAARLPRLAIVVDHGATPPIRCEDQRSWFDGVARLGSQPSIITKFSGLAEEAPLDWSIDLLRPAFRHLMASFGPSRMMWASNWPVIDMRGGYERWAIASRALLDELTLNAEDRRMIESGAAQRFYRLP